jgi:hypothetical protein
MRKTRKTAAVAVLAAATGMVLMGASPALADDGNGRNNQHPVDRADNRSDTGGQQNKDWGKVASNVARLDTDAYDGEGGAMGQHSRSTQAADINGGFASSDNGFGITLSDNTDGSVGREGVGNVSADNGNIHHTSPGDGGNGVHAVNNAGLAETLNPVNGEFTENAGGTAPDVSDELLEGTSADPTP